MAVPKNIDTFNRIALAILTHLYAEFPDEINFNPRDVAQPVLEHLQDEELFAALGSSYAVLRFLEREGFVHVMHGHAMDGDAQGAVLTMKGLGILGSVPKTVADDKTLAEHAKEALKEGASASISETFGRLMGAALGGLLGS